jgi:peroxiredoxin Q/BCP
MDNLKVSDPAPEFTLPALTKDGESVVALEDLCGSKNIVLYFYPKDDTPGCTKEACAFRDLEAQFKDAGAVILGISPDRMDDHKAFAEKHSIPFTLLTDPDHSVADTYGVWKDAEDGRTHAGVDRTTFVIGKDGNIAKIYSNVKVDQHAEEVLDFVKSLS